MKNVLQKEMRFAMNNTRGGGNTGGGNTGTGGSGDDPGKE